ncbi:AIM24 family protein [Gracilibacillus halotolerans]|uniref:AIM24 family protein n=1 Tax=Gracilibacillus halotolerans TaxID=74386 RepID=UPI003CCDDC05
MAFLSTLPTHVQEKLIPLNLSMHGSKIFCQKDAFLADAKDFSLDIEFQRKIRTNFFGGERFITQ